MTDIFFSYRASDRERVRPIHDALVARGFDVFWDQAVPAGVDWDTWIRQHLTKSKCAFVFWSSASVVSDNVRHEAALAKLQGKLIQILLEPLTPDQFPMGHYSQQGANLSSWPGDVAQDEWQKVIREIELRLTPPWAQQRIFELEAELTVERTRRGAAEKQVKPLQAQITKAVEAQDQLKLERDQADNEVATLKTDLTKLEHSLLEAEERLSGKDSELLHLQAKLEKQQTTLNSFEQERRRAAKEIAALNETIKQLNRPLADPWGPP